MKGLTSSRRARRGSVGMLAGLALWGAGALTAPTMTLALAAPALPTVGGHALPEGRTYEQVTPQDKNGGNLFDFFSGLFYVDQVVAAPDGESVEFASYSAFADSLFGGLLNSYVAKRDATGWSTHAVLPALPHSAALSTASAAFSPDLKVQVFGSAGASIVPGELTNTSNLYLRNDEDDTNQVLTKGSVAEPTGDSGTVDGFSADDTQVLFEDSNPLTANSPGTVHENLYDFSGGSPTLVGILPDGSVAASGAQAGGIGTTGSAVNAISADGSRIFFNATPPSTSEPQLYVRESALGPNAQTKEVSASQKTNGSGPGGTDASGPKPASYWDATPDGSAVFFTSPAELTNDANTGVNDAGSDLYRFDVNSGALTDLSADHNPADGEGAHVYSVLGTSADGSRVYFAALGDLAEGAQPEALNLYLSERGTIRWVSVLQGVPNRMTARVTPDGTHLLFESTLNSGFGELYIYDATSDSLSCVSCNPDGSATASVYVPAAAEPGSTNLFMLAPRYLSDDGSRVFFDSPEALVPWDTNGQTDVYEWHDGSVSLISSGQDGEPSLFQDASASGDDVFFGTRQRLVGEDIDEGRDLYDARVDGRQRQPTAPVCSGTGCQGTPPAPPIFATPASTTFNGVGNFPAVTVKQEARPKSKSSTRALKLAKALKACRGKHGKQQRKTCEALARKRYGSTPKAKKTNRRGN